MFDLNTHIEARKMPRETAYVLGSIWKRRDGKQAVIVSNEKNGMVRVIAVSDAPEIIYLAYADTGHVSKRKQANPMDLIYRDED